MKTNDIPDILERNYNLNIKGIELFREGGNLAYVVFDRDTKYFLKVVRPPFIENVLRSIDIQLYLMKNRFPVIPIILTKDDTAYVKIGNNNEVRIFILYEYIEGDEPARENTEKVGELIGRLHKVMKDYTGELPVRDKHFFIERYLEIMKIKQYDKVDAFREYGEELWESIKNLPRGYCHCDFYRGNVHQDSSGILRVTDFDTSCYAFPMYDVVLFCNDTHWFNFEYDGYGKSKARLEQSLKGYLKYCSLSKEEIAAFYDMIAVYHFQLQATMMEIHGYDCVDTNYFDKQYDWLMKWKEQCKAMSKLRSKSDIVGFAWRTRQVNMIDFREMQEKDIAFLSELLNEGQIIASLHNAVMSYEEWLDTYRKYWKDDDDEKHFIIHEDENPVGWIKLNGLKNPGTAWISMLAVSTKQQKKGIGYRAVTFAEEYVKSRGFAKIGIHTTEDNLIAQKLYKKCGYSIIEYGACTTGDGVQRMGYTFMKNLDCIE